jgi:hypothetical protein
MSNIYLYSNVLKTLSAKTPFVSVQQAKRATIEYNEQDPTVGYLTVLEFDKELTEKERLAYQPPTEFPSFSELF